MLTSTRIDEGSWMVTPFTDADELAVRLLLPVIDYSSEQPAGFVAVIGGPRRVLGAAVAWCRAIRGCPGGVPCAVQVAGPWQRMGIATALIDALGREVREWGATSLTSYAKVMEGGTIQTGWRRMGFANAPWLVDYDADPRVMAVRSEGLLEWCVQTGRVPADANVRRATADDATVMARLECAALGGVPWQAFERLAKHLRSPQCRALVVERPGRVCGFCVSLLTAPATLAVEMHVVDPAFRGGWAEAMLRHRFFEQAAAEGIEHLHFSASEREPNTQNLARRARATVLARHAIMVRPVTG